MIKHHDMKRLQYTGTRNPTLLSFKLDDRGGSDTLVTGKLRGNDLCVAVTHGTERNHIVVPTHLIRDVYSCLTELLNEAADSPDLHEYV